MNGKTCARIRHSIIFNGFRRRMLSHTLAMLPTETALHIENVTVCLATIRAEKSQCDDTHM